MSNSITSWFFEPPIDFESKKYRLLDNALKAEKLLEEGDMQGAMDFIEDHLVCFYKFKTEKEIINFNNKEIIGIDPLMLNLVFADPEINVDRQKEIDILCDVAELGVLEFEGLNSLFRIKWRDIDDVIRLSYMPEKPPLLNHGHVFLSNPKENWTRLYTFENPENCSDWTSFKLNFHTSHDYNQSKILDFVRVLKEKESNNIILSGYIDESFKNMKSIDFILSCKIYYRLLKDYMF